MTWTVADTATTIPARFAAQARLHADRTAISGTGWEPTYAELDAAADRLAHAILDRVPGPPGRIAILMDHDAPLLAAALGVLKAGRTAVALYPGDPPARHRQILDDTDVELLVCDEAHRAHAGACSAADPLVVDRQPDASPGPAPPSAASPDDAAFLIYTSGSTGMPKGVVQTHRTMLHNVLRHTNGLQVTAADRMALLAPLSGGQGVGTTWTTLLNGATLCPFPIGERGVADLGAFIDEQAISILPASASVFRSFARTLRDERFDSVRLVRLGSEPVLRGDHEAFRQHFSPDARLANTLSSSETGTVARCFFAPDADVPGDRLPAGRAVDGVEILLLDEHGEKADHGEIVVRSAFLSPGYWRDQARTAGRFSGEGGRRVFRTGDLGRRGEDGALTVLGRVDHQVKVHGHRVDLGDVEAALAALPEVASAAVAASPTPRGEVRLTGYVVARDEHEATPAGVRERLLAALPAHAVPTAFVFVDAIPLSPHGKVDRAALAAVAPPAPGLAAPPASEVEERVAALFAGALDVESVARDSGFMDLGGDSLAAAEVAAGMRDAFGVELRLRSFTDNPTVVELAVIAQTGATTADAPPPLTPAPRDRPLPLSFSQQQMWRTAHEPTARLGHNMPSAIRFRGDLDVDALRGAIDHLVARHEVLRTTFTPDGDSAVQTVHPPAPLPLPLSDLRAHPDPEARAYEIIMFEAFEPFDLVRGPLLRTRLLRLDDDEHWLLRCNHHGISDGPSWTIFFRELRALYEAAIAGEPAPIPDRAPIQYGDFAAWQRRWLEPGGAKHRAELDWWRGVLAEPHEPIVLPPQRLAPPAEPPDPGIHWWGIDPETAVALDRLAQSAGATYLMVRLAVFSALLASETGREDLVIGTVVGTRGISELQGVFGDFSNLTVLRMRFSGDPTFRAWLADVRETIVATSEHVDLPYAHVVEGLAAEGIAVPELRVLFGRTYQTPPLRFGGLEVDRMRVAHQLEPTGFTFAVDRWYETSRNAVYFDSGSYDPAEVSAFVERYTRLCAAVCEHPDRPLRALAG